jgi:glycosyltransferase involved in cell wall biosynthesis
MSKALWEQPGRGSKAVRRHVAAVWNTARTAVAGAAAQLRRADVAIFHDFVPPPIGGGHQFLRALWREMEGRGWRVEGNTISRTTRACLYNSFNFDFERLRRLRRPGCRMVHRVDGPVGVYRGRDDGTDRRIWQINHELADATIFQSAYSLQKHRELGLEFTAPTVVLNAADAAIFHSHGRVALDTRRKVRLISTSWSDNPHKGAAAYRWLDDHLDWDRFDYTFVGRSGVRFTHIRALPPAPSGQLAELLRQHDIFITASRDDPCSNALIEALSCGLPALYLRSGGHPEIVGNAGFGFESPEEIPVLLDRLVAEYAERQAQIAVPALAEVADRYLAVMGIGARPAAASA